MLTGSVPLREVVSPARLRPRLRLPPPTVRTRGNSAAAEVGIFENDRPPVIFCREEIWSLYLT